MKVSKSQTILSELNDLVQDLCTRNLSRTDIIEYLACDIGRIEHSHIVDLVMDNCGKGQAFQNQKSRRIELDTGELMSEVERLCKEHENLQNFHVIAMLSDQPLPPSERKEKGVYYTDYRLSQVLGNELKKARTTPQGILEMSCGSAILAGEATEYYAGGNKVELNRIVREEVHLWDISAQALRSALATYCTFGVKIDDLRGLVSRMRLGDSLQMYNAPEFHLKIGLIVGNPPWEKLGVDKQEIAKSLDSSHIYGSKIPDLMKDVVKTMGEEKKAGDKEYIKELENSGYELQDGAKDLYKFFLELAMNLLSPSGNCVMILPGSIIRSESSSQLRVALFTGKYKQIRIQVTDNSEAYFSEVDARKKIVILSFKGSKRKPSKISIGGF